MILCSVDAQTLPTIPDTLKPPSAQKLYFQAKGEGNQIYSCDGEKWVLTGPKATLLGEDGKPVGSHFAGPTWEAQDGSRVVARPVADFTSDPKAIPWLLLKASDHQGDGVMRPVVSIQRLSTKGGKAPESGCNASKKSAEVHVPYTAIYYFFAEDK